MTSRSHKKHRTIRWNIRPTVTASLLAGAIFSAGIFSSAHGDEKESRAADFEVAVRSRLAQRERAVSPGLQQNRDRETITIDGQRVVVMPPLEQWVKPATPAEPFTVPPVPGGNAAVSGKIKLASFPPGESTKSGVISIPDTAPAPAAAEQPVIVTTGGKKKQTEGKKKQKKFVRWTAWDGTMFKRNTKTGVTKTRRMANWIHGAFIDDKGPDGFDPDEYPRPIVLVGNTVEDETDPESTVPDVPDEADANQYKQPVLTRSLTDIQPTLKYAWGDFKEEELPEDFYARIDHKPIKRDPTPQTVLQWAPTNLWHHPLYFQDVGLERYGHTHKPWIQPFVSSSRFFGQVVGLPYQMTLHPPKSREFTLGYYQPGEWAPKKHYQIPFNEEAAATEFLWVTGLILLIP